MQNRLTRGGRAPKESGKVHKRPPQNGTCDFEQSQLMKCSSRLQAKAQMESWGQGECTRKSPGLIDPELIEREGFLGALTTSSACQPIPSERKVLEGWGGAAKVPSFSSFRSRKGGSYGGFRSPITLVTEKRTLRYTRCVNFCISCRNPLIGCLKYSHSNWSDGDAPHSVHQPYQVVSRPHPNPAP